MNVTTINDWNVYEAREAFRRCCGSTRWVEGMEWLRPFESEAVVLGTADRIWWALEPTDWLEAFAAHPEIGTRETPPVSQASTAAWSKAEQSGTERAPRSVLATLAELEPPV